MNSTYKRQREDDDPRYTLRLSLIRDGRPKYWDFHCVFCGLKIGELNANKIYATDTVYDQPPFRFKCPGTPKKWCRMWYEVYLSE